MSVSIDVLPSIYQREIYDKLRLQYPGADEVYLKIKAKAITAVSWTKLSNEKKDEYCKREKAKLLRAEKKENSKEKPPALKRKIVREIDCLATEKPEISRNNGEGVLDLGWKGRFKHDKEADSKIIKYPCSRCSYVASTKHNLTRHIKIKHERRKTISQLPCDVCGLFFRSLQAHKKKHAPVNWN